MQTALETYQGSWRMPSFETATVAEVMHPGVMVCRPDESLVNVARAFASHHMHAVLVEGISKATDGHGERLMWRVLSDRDLMGVAAAGLEGTAADAAHTEAPTIPGDASLASAARLMNDHGVSHLIVMSEGRPVGVLSSIDIAGTIAWGRA